MPRSEIYDADDVCKPVTTNVRSTFHGRRLRVSIIGARGLPRSATQRHKGNRTGVYCGCQVAGKPETTVQSRIVRYSENPVWDSVAYMNGYMVGDSLVFRIYGQEYEDDISLGQAVL